MNSPEELYNQLRAARGYLPTWAELTPKRRKEFAKVYDNTERLAGTVYYDKHREAALQAMGRLMNYPCGEIILVRR